MEQKSAYIIIKEHFDNLISVLDKNNFKAILIIDYLINFLGCLVLSELIKKHKGVEISKNKNISNLTAGEWARYIGMWISEFSTQDNNKALSSVKEEFFQNEDYPKPKGYIEKWIQLRNILSHDVILADDGTLTELISTKLFDPFRHLNFFIDSLLKVVDNCKNILNSHFFHYLEDNGALYIYTGIDRDWRDIGFKYKYKHFKIKPMSIFQKNFPLPHREVFLSLSPTPSYILSGKDFIMVEMKTSRSITYKNDFELWINKEIITKVFRSYVDGDYLTFPSDGFSFAEGEGNNVEVRAIRNGMMQASDAKSVSIFSTVPDAKINWVGTEGKKIPVVKLSNIKLFLQSVFEIKDITIDLFNYSESIVLDNEHPMAKATDAGYLATFNIQSTQIGESTVKANISYTNRIGEKKIQSIDLKVNCTPNFFEPDFEGESRMTIIANMRSIRRNYLIIGEGGVGKSRLIAKYFYPLGNNPYEITANPAMRIAYQFAEILKMPFREKEKYDDKIAKIINWFEKEAVSGIERYFWIKDCHEIRNEQDRSFLRTISQICSDAGNNIMIFIESRDETWGDDAKKLIEELKLTDAVVIPLDRLNKEELVNIIDSVFNPNKFALSLKWMLTEKSDGIVYILLEYLKHLYDLGVFVVEENKIWINQNLSNLDEILKTLEFTKVLKMNIDFCLKILDQKNLDDKGRDLLTYLCLGSIDIEILHQLMNINPSSLQRIIDIFESNYLIRRQESKYEFHHQLKRDFYKDSFLTDHIINKYFIELLPFNELGVFYGDAYDNEMYLKEEFFNMSEPRLKEKVEGLLSYIEVDDMPENTINVLHKYYKVLPIYRVLYCIESALFYYAQELNLERYIDFHPLKAKIDHIIVAKKLYDITLYENDDALKGLFTFVKIRSEIYDLLQIFYEEYFKISPPKGDKVFVPCELLSPILKLTDIFLSNNNFLDKTYEILLDIYHIYLHFDSSRHSGYLDLPPISPQDFYNSIAHLQGLRILNNQEKRDEYLGAYKEYFDKLFSFPFSKDYSTTMKFLEFHERHILKDYPEMLDRMSKYISDIKINLIYGNESEDIN